MIRSFNGKTPKVHRAAFVSEAAYLVGDVEVGEGAVILPGAVLRGDTDTIRVSSRAIVGENCVVHVDEGGLDIGDGAIIDSGAIVHCKAVGDGAFIGSNAVLLEGARIDAGAIVQAAAVVRGRSHVPHGTIVGGIPAQHIGEVSREDRERLIQRASREGELASRAERDSWPEESQIPQTCLISETSTIYGHVTLADRVSIFPGVVLRGDVGPISIGEASDIQDRGLARPGPEGMEIGRHVLIGHSVILHARRIGSNCLIGNNCTLSEGVEIGDFCVIGAGCMVPPGTRIPSHSFVLGVPATVRGQVSQERLSGMGGLGEGYASHIQRSQHAGMDARSPKHKGMPPMLVELEGKSPRIAASAYVNESAYLIGEVEVGEGSSLWPGVVVRGDLKSIVIGSNSNIQDNTVVHGNWRTGIEIGDNVMIGHGCMVHAKRIGNNCLIGNNATVMEDVEIGDFCIVAANALVPPRTIVPSYSIVAGVPAETPQPLPERWRERMPRLGEGYARKAQQFKAAGL